MRFTTELLPLLAGQPGVAVEVSGEPADYREAGDSLRIGVSTGEVAGDNDWFDLGVTIMVEGREVPFTDVFTALSRGESHLLLPDGAYFSLDKPELRQLASLIEEARALQDTAAARCGSAGSRPGCGKSWPRSAWSAVRRRRGSSRCRACSRSAADGISGSGRGSRRTPCGPSCVPTSWTGSSGWRSCGSTSSAASSPTTWGSARRSRRWR